MGNMVSIDMISSGVSSINVVDLEVIRTGRSVLGMLKQLVVVLR